jgi:hypothetical protein
MTRTFTPAQAARRDERNRARIRRWRSMDLFALMDLKARLEARDYTILAVLWKRIVVESSKVRDPRYRAQVMDTRALNGRPILRAAPARTYIRSAS